MGRITDAFVRGSPFLRWPAVDQDASVRPHRPFHCCSWLPLAACRMLTAICAGEAEGAAAPVLNQAYETLMTLATKKHKYHEVSLNVL